MGFYTEIVCEGCSTCITIGSIATKGSMRRIARKNGWSVGKYHLCPDCRKNRKKLVKEGWLKKN